MADNLQRRQPEDKRFISLSESWEVAYWTQKRWVLLNLSLGLLLELLVMAPLR